MKSFKSLGSLLVLAALLTACNEQDRVSLISEDFRLAAAYEEHGLTISAFNYGPVVSATKNPGDAQAVLEAIVSDYAATINNLATGTVVLDLPNGYDRIINQLKRHPGRQFLCVAAQQDWPDLPAPCEGAISVTSALNSIAGPIESAPVAPVDNTAASYGRIMMIVSPQHTFGSKALVDGVTVNREEIIRRRALATSLLAQQGFTLEGVVEDAERDTHYMWLVESGSYSRPYSRLRKSGTYVTLAAEGNQPPCDISEWVRPEDMDRCD